MPVLDTGARGSTVTFAQKGTGDVLLNWENEAWLALEEFGADKFEIVYPSVSILAEPPVAVVDKVVDAKGTRAGGRGVPEVPLHAGGAGRRRRSSTTARATPRCWRSTRTSLPPIKLFTIDEAFGGWDSAHKALFADGGVFDQLYKP